MKLHPRELLKEHVRQSVELKDRAVASCSDEMDASCQLLLSTLRDGGKILACGNGGSAADAQHFVSELVNLFSQDAKERRPFPALALSVNASLLTATSIDYGFDRIFARQVEALGNKGDVLVAITTRGNSQNVIAAAQAARLSGMKVVGLTGETGGGLVPHCDVCVRVPGQNTHLVQEAHESLLHVWVEYLEGNYR